MDTANARLKSARERRFETAKEAAEAMGIPVSTYIGHENGHRGFPASRAPTYARKFGVTEEWLLYGKGAMEPTTPSAEVIERMLRETIDSEVTLGTKLADLPRIFAPALSEQLERWQADRSRMERDAASAPGKGGPSLSPTRRGARAGSRSS